MTAQKIIDNVTRKLEGVPGIVGVVLGGSRARGTHRPDSDIDIGIYYDESAGFDVARLNEIAKELLQEAIMKWFLFEASFSLMFVDKAVHQDDLSYVAGHCFRAISSLNQVLFAKNKQYCINEKKAVMMVDQFAIKPVDYKKRVDQIFTLLSKDENQTRQAADMLRDLVAETEKILQSK
ncbi:hypothetical protein C1X05_08815 [Laceyella sacchari]|nr:hypothetical protein C1X05_08815 [Laceyella sacchari]